MQEKISEMVISNLERKEGILDTNEAESAAAQIRKNDTSCVFNNNQRMTVLTSRIKKNYPLIHGRRYLLRVLINTSPWPSFSWDGSSSTAVTHKLVNITVMTFEWSLRLLNNSCHLRDWNYAWQLRTQTLVSKTNFKDEEEEHEKNICIVSHVFLLMPLFYEMDKNNE